MNHRTLIFIFSLLISFSSHARQQFFSDSHVGCLNPMSDFLRLECVQQKISFDILKRLHRSRKPHLQKELTERLLSRARYFLAQKRFDYQSVVALMSFPVTQRKLWLERFSKLPGTRVHYAKLALLRLSGETPKECQGNRQHNLLYREICQLPVY